MGFDKPPALLASLQAADTVSVASVAAILAGGFAAAMVNASQFRLLSRRGLALVAAAAAAGGIGIAHLKIKDHEDNVIRTRQFYLQRRFSLRQHEWAELAESAGQSEDEALQQYLRKIVAYDMPLIVPKESLAAAAAAELVEAAVDAPAMDPPASPTPAASLPSMLPSATVMTSTAEVAVALLAPQQSPVRLA